MIITVLLLSSVCVAMVISELLWLSVCVAMVISMCCYGNLIV